MVVRTSGSREKRASRKARPVAFLSSVRPEHLIISEASTARELR